MQQKELISTPVDLSSELILVDDALIDLIKESQHDLYLELVRQPSFKKQESLKYDYRPAASNFLCDQEKLPKNEELENISELANEVSISKGIKCNCSKTKCQKNYCQCFKAGLSCGTDCSCTQCCNDQASKLALPKRNSASGCKCQKSHCLKNYCECHSGGRKCTGDCRCIQCHNLEAFSNEEEQLQEISKLKKKVKKDKQILSLSLMRKTSVENRII